MSDWTEQRAVKIKKQTALGEFNDMIYYTTEQYGALTPTQIDSAVQTRVDNWVAFVNAQSKKVPVEPSKAELQAQVVELQGRITTINARIAIITSKVVEK